MNVTTAPEEYQGEAPPRHRRRRMRLRPRDLSAVYLMVLVVVAFAAWSPSQFLREQTIYLVLNQNAIPCLLALALIVPLTAGVYDLSVGYILGTSNVFVAAILAHSHISGIVVLILGVLLGALVGVVNALIVVILGIDSFIATLATGSLLQALILIISNNQNQTNGITASFTKIVSTTVHGVALPVIYVAVIGLIIWYFLEHRPVGRELRATGLGLEAARLVGVRVNLLRFCSLIVSGSVAGFAGGLVAATVGGGSPTIGPPYLIPAFTAVFLGATLLRPGLFNVWGTVLSIILLGILDVGLSLIGVPIWVSYAVSGVVLIAALALTAFSRSRAS